MERLMIDFVRVETEIAKLMLEADKLRAETAKLNREAKWHPATIIAAAVGAGAALMGALTGAAVLILKQFGA